MVKICIKKTEEAREIVKLVKIPAHKNVDQILGPQQPSKNPGTQAWVCYSSTGGGGGRQVAIRSSLAT